MATTSEIVPVGFHVQNTAKAVRHDFPYFSQHDSVSALWSEKWCDPCAKGIYPFDDGSIDDFVPIIQQLILRSNDNPSILYQPDEYAEPFLEPAARLVSEGHEALANGRRKDARDLFLRAAAVYRIARFPVVRSPLGREAWARGNSATSIEVRIRPQPSGSAPLVVVRANRSSGLMTARIVLVATWV